MESARDNIRYWCNIAQNKRKQVFTFGGEGDFEDNNYIQPDLVALKCDEVGAQRANDERWTEVGEHFGCEELVEQITNDNNKLPANYLIEVCVLKKLIYLNLSF